MSTDEVKEVARRLREVMDREGPLAAAEQCVAPDARFYLGTNPEPMNPRAWAKQVASFYDAFAAGEHIIEEMIAEGDSVAIRQVWRARHVKPFQGIPPSGKVVAVHGIVINRVRDGKIVEQRATADILDFLQQLGAAPSRSVLPVQSTGT